MAQDSRQAALNKSLIFTVQDLRIRGHFRHDVQSLSLNRAILSQAGETQLVINNYRWLRAAQKLQLITLLRSL